MYECESMCVFMTDSGGIRCAPWDNMSQHLPAGLPVLFCTSLVSHGSELQEPRFWSAWHPNLVLYFGSRDSFSPIIDTQY